ncbi:MAG: fimbria/pilus outer membrane usher protein [Acinetobacter sp.]
MIKQSARRSALFQALLCASGLSGSLALASEPLRLDSLEQQELYLSVVLNQASSSAFGHFIQTPQDLLISRETLQELQLKINAPDAPQHAGFISLAQIPGLSYDYNALAQSIQLNVSASFLQANTVAGFTPVEAAKVNARQIRPGALFNYDFYAQAAEDAWSLSGWNELRFFGFGEGNVLSISANHAYTQTEASAELKSQILDTYWQKDFAGRALTLTLGDSQTRALDWSRSARISGIKLAKNYSLQPYQVTSPLASFKDSVLLPSTIDLLINGIQQSSSEVLPGQFNIQTAPSITGAGTAQLLITDLNGQRRAVNFSLFGTSRLLQRGLSDWEVNLGVNKLNYAVKSFSYGHELLMNATFRHGLSSDTTLESHAEYSNAAALAGLGIVHRLPDAWGVLNGSYSRSELNGQAGQAYSAGYEWNNRLISFSMRHQQSDGNFGDLASGLGYAYIDRSDHAFFGLNTRFGQFGSSYAAQQYQGIDNKYLIFNWSYYFPSKSYLTLNMTRNLNEKDHSFFMSLNIPLDRQTNAAVNGQKNPDYNKVSASVRRTALQNQADWGWQGNVEYSNPDNYSLQGQLQRETSVGQWDVGVQNARINGEDYSTAVGSARGSLVLMNRSLFAMRQSLNSFAVVSTAGVADIPVRLENRLVGKTNRKGLLLIDSLNPYQHNAVSIDALDLPLEYKIESTQLDAVPYSGSGLYLNFPIYKMRAVQWAAVDAQNQPLKMGSQVWAQPAAPHPDDPEQTIVGRDGMIYLENPAAAAVFAEHEGKICRMDLPDFSAQYGFLDLGNLTCQ